MAYTHYRAFGLYFVLAIGLGMGLCVFAAARENGDAIQITNLPPDPRGGQAYRLTYRVPVPADIFWRFKTDFSNSFLEENRHILEHRLVWRKGNTVITENRYINKPDALFRWRTTVFPESMRLEFELINADKVDQRFHYGYIQITPMEQATRVTQVAFFDFAGSYFWSHYPWSGGMRAFLEYTAKWERKTAQRLRGQYSRPSPDRGSGSSPP
jgi:hypothetical protein